VINVAIIDDQDLVREGLAMIVGSAPDIDVVLSGADGQDLIDAVSDRRPIDVALVDIRMPGVDGLEATRRVVGRPGAPAVLILTTFSDDDYVLGAVAAGASGFLLKRASGQQLISAVRSIAEGDAVLSPSVTRQMLARMRAGIDSGGEPVPVPSLSYLTDRETDVLRCIGDGLNNAEIAATLFLSESTVKTHVGNVLAKTHSRDRVRAALLAVRTGLAELDVD
jgi:DNA-binding NarL/FixJ family response regulator